MISSLFFGLAHALNDQSTLAGVLNLALAGLTFGLGYVLTGQLAIPIGLHISWDFFESAVFGLPVAGNDPIGAASVVGIEQDGPPLWTGGSFGPQGGLLFVGAMVAGALFVALWVRGRSGRLAVHVRLAEEPKRYSEIGVATTSTGKG